MAATHQGRVSARLAPAEGAYVTEARLAHRPGLPPPATSPLL